MDTKVSGTEKAHELPSDAVSLPFPQLYLLLVSNYIL